MWIHKCHVRGTIVFQSQTIKINTDVLPSNVIIRTLIKIIHIDWLKVTVCRGKNIFQTGIQGSKGSIRSGALRGRRL